MAMAVAIIALSGIPAKGDSAAGQATYKAKCAMCHGPDGTGKTPMGQSLKIPDLHSDAVQKKTDAELTQVITKGSGKMPAYEAKLSKEQITDLVGYIRDLAKKN